MAVNLDPVAHGVHAQLLGIELVDDDAVRPAQIIDAARHEVPRHEPGMFEIDADNDDRLGPAIGSFPRGEADDERSGGLDTRHGKGAVAVAPGNVAGLIDVARTDSRDPEIGDAVIDEARGCGGEAEQQRHLHRHQDDGEGDTGKRRGKTDAVLGEVAPRQRERDGGQPAARRARRAGNGN